MIFFSKKLRLVILFIFSAGIFTGCKSRNYQKAKIDRHALVTRHNVHITSFDSLASLSVGNGDFAFTVGATGLQTFPEYYEKGIPLGTQSQWGWHSFPNPNHYSITDVTKKIQSCNGRKVPYDIQPHNDKRGEAASHWLRTNPHRLHLGIVGLILKKDNGNKVQIGDIKNIHQKLNLWTGKVDSRYTIDGQPVHVQLFSHQDKDQISVQIKSPLIKEQRLNIKLHFPYGSDCHVCAGYDWTHPDKYKTVEVSRSKQSALLEQELDSTTYYAAISWEGKGTLDQTKKHLYKLIPAKGQDTFSFNVLYSEQKLDKPSSFEVTRENSINAWKTYWTQGGAVDFSVSTDPRADELERRVVLSQYLTKIQTSGSLPPQETGLTMNSWYGKFHLEMHWWHGVHYALWDRLDLLENSMLWYKKVQGKAQKTAEMQGYKGVRWQKMTGPNGRKSPSNIGEFLIWQQPHVIYFAELFYRQHPTKETLERFKYRVFQTADFMASFATLDKIDGKYHLCAPLIPAQEIFHANTTKDPPFELAYWHYGLSVAQKWRKRLGLKPSKKWQQVLDNLAPLPTKNGLYLPDASSPNAYTEDKYRRDHPMVTGAFGLLPDSGMIDTTMMRKTFDEVMRKWDWKSTWGWDYPMLAMTAARLGEPEKAVDALLMDKQKNTYLKNGHNYQNERLRLYLPGNGGLLTAVAMMAAGWDGAPNRNAPGFPNNENWKIRWENLKKMP